MACGQLGSPHSYHPGPTGHSGGAGREEGWLQASPEAHTAPTRPHCVCFWLHMEGSGCRPRPVDVMSTLEVGLLGPVRSAGKHCSCARGLVLGVQGQKWGPYRKKNKTVYRKRSALDQGMEDTQSC